MQLSVADLLLWHMKGASRLPCHYCRRAMWRSPDVNMGVSMLEWWKLSSSDRQEGLMFKLLLPWKQTLVLGGSSSYCGSECKWMLLVKGNDHFWYMCTDMMMLWSSVLLNWSDPWHSPSQKKSGSVWKHWSCCVAFWKHCPMIGNLHMHCTCDSNIKKPIFYHIFMFMLSDHSTFIDRGVSVQSPRNYC